MGTVGTLQALVEEAHGGSYLVPGPPNLDIRDISFKLRYITRVSQSFSRSYDGFGHTEVEQWFCLREGRHMIFFSIYRQISG